MAGTKKNPNDQSGDIPLAGEGEAGSAGLVQFDAALKGDFTNLKADPAMEQAVNQLFGKPSIAADGSYIEVGQGELDSSMLIAQAMPDAGFGSIKQAADSRGMIPGGIVYDETTGVFDLEASRKTYHGPYAHGSHHFDVHQNTWSGDRIDGSVVIDWKVPQALEPGTYKVHDLDTNIGFVDNNTGERIKFPPGVGLKMDGELHVEPDGRRWFEGTIQYPFRKADGTFENVTLKCDKRNPFVLNQREGDGVPAPSDGSSGF